MNAIERAAEAVLDYCGTEPDWSTGKAAAIIKRELEKAVPAMKGSTGIEHYDHRCLGHNECRKAFLGE